MGVCEGGARHIRVMKYLTAFRTTLSHYSNMRGYMAVAYRTRSLGPFVTRRPSTVKCRHPSTASRRQQFPLKRDKNRLLIKIFPLRIYVHGKCFLLLKHILPNPGNRFRLPMNHFFSGLIPSNLSLDDPQKCPLRRHRRPAIGQFV